MRSYEFVESFLEGHELFLDANLEPPLDVEVDVLFLVLIRDRDVLATGSQVVVGDLSKSVVLYTERHVKYVSDVIIPVMRGGRGEKGEREEGKKICIRR